MTTLLSRASWVLIGKRGWNPIGSVGYWSRTGSWTGSRTGSRGG